MMVWFTESAVRRSGRSWDLEGRMPERTTREGRKFSFASIHDGLLAPSLSGLPEISPKKLEIVKLTKE